MKPSFIRRGETPRILVAHPIVGGFAWQGDAPGAVPAACALYIWPSKAGAIAPTEKNGKNRAMCRNHLRITVLPSLAALLLLCCASLAPTNAQDAPAPDPLLAIGWLGFDMTATSGTASCSGVLVAPDLVATAAHCVMNAKTGAPRPVAKITFAAGRMGDTAAALRHGTNVILPAPRSLLSGALPYDLALLRLDAPIPAADVTPMSLAPSLPQEGDSLLLWGYARETPSTPTDRSDCIVRLVTPDVIGLTCPAVTGFSGGAILDTSTGTARLAAIMVARGQGPNSLGTYAVTMPADLFALLPPQPTP